MISINLAEDQVPGYLESIEGATLHTSVNIACINSPLNCTLSGTEAAIDAIKSQADKDGIFAQKLKTGVAYHSPSMLAIAEEYLSLMGILHGVELDTKTNVSIPMVSTVSAKVISYAELATGKYWVENMVSPVRFSQALQVLTQESSTLGAGVDSITDLVEVGPHPALRRPVKDTVGQAGNSKEIWYESALYRTKPAVESVLELIGQLFCRGHVISVSAANQAPANGLSSFLVECPEYSFDHSQQHWSESRISQNFRLREAVRGETLGVRVSDWNPLEPRWRNFLCTESIPWIGDHVVSSSNEDPMTQVDVDTC